MSSGIEIIAQKELDSQTKLELISWVSEVIAPNRRGYQLALIKELQGCKMTSQFPTNWEDYTGDQIRSLYTRINSSEDFKNFEQKGSL